MILISDMKQNEIDRQRIEQEVKAFEASGGVIQKLGHWVGPNGYPVKLNRDTKKRKASKARSENALKMTHSSR